MALPHAILAALIECPFSGYDLAKRFDGSVGFFWNASHQQIYRELSKLEAEGLITAEKVEQDGRPNKKLYSITSAGKAMLQEWIAQPAEVSPVKDDLLVKLFAGHIAPRETILQKLKEHYQQHRAKLEGYQAIAQQHFSDPAQLSEAHKFQFLTLRAGIRHEMAWMTWCGEAMTFLTETESNYQASLYVRDELSE